MLKALLIFALCLAPVTIRAEVQLTSHSYIHNPSGQTHVVFHLASYKRGWFFGSCGPSTRSLQWEYQIEMKGAGPNYRKDDIELKDGDYRPIPLEDGVITIEEKSHKATISLTPKQDLSGKTFHGNGTYKIQLRK
ncbi:MAG TPA: hypothetical protein VL361_29270 [Candidatus Limnocylindrales bacterium]|jgi:hypothetical protein|nr:hypothetical protein [Candidatus Limnocylindrales bacterium]